MRKIVYTCDKCGTDIKEWTTDHIRVRKPEYGFADFHKLCYEEFARFIIQIRIKHERAS